MNHGDSIKNCISHSSVEMDIMIDHEYIKQEIEKLGFDFKTDRIVRLPGEDCSKEYVLIVVPLSGEGIVGNQHSGDTAYFDFGISAKINSELPLLDHLAIRVERTQDFLSDQPIVLMQQAFRAEWGPLPSKQCLMERAKDYLTPRDVSIKYHTTFAGKLKAELENLGFNYEKLVGFPSGHNTLCYGQVIPMQHISHQNDQLVNTFNIPLNINTANYPIDSMTSSLRRSTPEGNVCLMREIHFSALETLPSMKHIYDRSNEILRVMKVSERFSINEEGRLIYNETSKRMNKGL